MTANSDANCRLYFGFGKDTGTYKFDNVSLTKIVPITIPHTNTHEVISGFDWNVFPNPANSLISVNFHLSDRQVVTFDLLSLDGKLLLKFQVGTLAKGEHNVQLNLGALKLNGVFILQLRTKNELFTRKIIIHSL